MIFMNAKYVFFTQKVKKNKILLSKLNLILEAIFQSVANKRACIAIVYGMNK